MCFFQWLLLLPIHLLMGLACWILSPILPIFAIGRDTLPKWLSWFQTPDAPLDGDSGFAVLYPTDKWPRYVRRVLWLIRNPAYGFAWTVLAYQPKSRHYTWRGSMPGGKPDGFGWYLIWQQDGHFQFFMRYPSIFGKHFYFRFGWKIIGLATHGGDNYLERKKYVFTLNPFDGG